MCLFAAGDDPTSHVKDLFLAGPLTMHTLTIVLVSGVFLWVMFSVAKRIRTGPESEGNERYITKGRLAQMIEAIVVYLRDQMLEPVLGDKNTRRYLPFLMSLFFFILFINLFGLIPIIDMLALVGVPSIVGGTATATITVTAALALVAFIVIEVHGIRELGLKEYILHNFGGLVPGPIYLFPVALIVFAVELLGHLIKPAALAIRLFANMVAGHTLMAVLLGFGAMAAKGNLGFVGTSSIALISGGAAVLITFLELFVAFLQAFIFMFLTAVFISLMSHHDEHHEEHEEHVAQNEMEAVPQAA